MLFFKLLHVNISYGCLLFLPSRLLVCLPHVRAGIPAVVCGELLGDYHSLGAAEFSVGSGWRCLADSGGGRLITRP